MRKNISPYAVIVVIIISIIVSILVRADVFIINPTKDQPCEIFDTKTIESALVELVKQFGKKAKVIQPPTNIKSNGRRIALIELPTKDGPMLFGITDGTIEWCYEWAVGVKAQLKNLEKPKLKSDWIRIGGTPDGSRNDYVDNGSIYTDESGLVRLLVKLKHSSIQKTPDGHNFNTSTISYALNCKDNTIAWTALSYYDKNGNVVRHTEVENSKWNFTDAELESLPSLLLGTHCPH